MSKSNEEWASKAFKKAEGKSKEKKGKPAQSQVKKNRTQPPVPTDSELRKARGSLWERAMNKLGIGGGEEIDLPEDQSATRGYGGGE